jgi:hypothetical protein
LETAPPGPVSRDTSQRWEVTPKSTALKAAGITKSVAHRAEQLAEAAPEVEAYIARKAGEGRPVKISEALAAAVAQRRESAAREVLHAAPVDMPEGLHVGDFRELAGVIPDASIDLIFTDPPYDREAIGLFEDAARIGARILKPGGSLIAYCGQIQLPEVLAGMAKHLRYWWVNACIHSGSTRLRMNKYGIVNQWKPLVWFVKGTRGDVQTFVDDAVSGGTEKAHHPWQQAQSEAAYYINSLCSPEGVVVDFCAGGGTTFAAARAVGRKCIGFELDELHATEIVRRLSA